jgi:transposase
MDALACHGCAPLIEQLQAKVAQLEAELAAVKKNSSTSSKPPSSDIVKPPRPKSKRKRKRGGQRGHQRHERLAFEADQIDDTVEYTLSDCPDCGARLKLRDEPPRIVQQVELVAKPTQVAEHRALAYWCAKCQKTHYAAINPAVRKAGLFGPALTTLVAYLKGACHCSFSTIRKFVRDVLKLNVSRGYLAKLIAKVSDSLQFAYDALLALLPQQKVVNTDETGHKTNGKALWTWCFRAPLFTLFKISPSRGADVLLQVLRSEFDGLLGCDYFSAYRKYMRECNVLVQFCLAHLVRDLKFLTTHPHGRTRVYGERVLKAVRALFAVIHRRDRMKPEAFQAALENAGDELWANAVWQVPNTKEARNLARRFEKHGASYIRFISTPDIDPTNNLAEQAIRFVVLDRHVTQGTRSQVGQRWSERIWTVIATCQQQGRDLFSFLADAISASFQGNSSPSLQPNTS